jgi:hypothetical protein
MVDTGRERLLPNRAAEIGQARQDPRSPIETLGRYQPAGRLATLRQCTELKSA